VVVKFYAFLIVGGLITSLMLDMWIHWLGFGLAIYVMQKFAAEMGAS